MTPSPSPFQQCEFEWSDGWSPEHHCHLQSGHLGDHRCRCDAFVSQWMGEHGDEASVESSEEARLRLREELKALQDKSDS